MLVARSLRFVQGLLSEPRPKGEGRTEAQIRRHYLVERGLAERLRNAPDAERRGLYPKIYDELFARLPDHPQLRAIGDPAAHARRMRSVEWQFAFLRRALTLRSRFMEVGAGDCALSRRVAGHVERVYAVDVSEKVMRPGRRAPNLVAVLSDGVLIPVPEGSVDVAFSNQLIEHLHPRDAAAQLAEIHRALAPGGRYFCITPNRFYGPRDVSAHYDEAASGLHLKEYSALELRALLLATGFEEVRFYAGGRGRFARVPYALVAAFEAALARLPRRLSKRLADNAPARALLGLRVEAVKPAR
jgi:SAM-dependent methyltransferase